MMTVCQTNLKNYKIISKLVYLIIFSNFDNNEVFFLRIYMPFIHQILQRKYIINRKERKRIDSGNFQENFQIIIKRVRQREQGES